MPVLPFGRRIYGTRGPFLGSGIPGYARHQGYTPSSIPTAVGARMFFPEPDRDTDDHPIPAATGNKWDGGRPAYQERVYAAAKKFGQEQGLKRKEIEELKPWKVA